MNCDITVVIPTYQRIEKLLEALSKIQACSPAPDEIILHIDGTDTVTESAVRTSQFQNVKVLKSNIQVGPGGGRNRAIAQAKHSIVASFDDDSYPIDSDYFARLIQLFDQFPQAAVIGAAIFHQNEVIIPDEATAKWTADFVGCGCAYRRDIFLQTNGYVELPLAYGMEEVDLSLRLHHMGWGVLQSPWLRVFHNTQLEHHQNPRITAASIANQALLTYLRYPISLWWLGSVQCFNRISWLVRHQRLEGIRAGVTAIPQLIQHQHHKRQIVSAQSIFSYLRLRRNAGSEPFALKVQ
ncbi:MAG TPA: glycosyltransferase [Trichocoleus sp.]|jgi:GT2 family glycosyltransferase